MWGCKRDEWVDTRGMSGGGGGDARELSRVLGSKKDEWVDTR